MRRILCGLFVEDFWWHGFSLTFPFFIPALAFAGLDSMRIESYKSRFLSSLLSLQMCGRHNSALDQCRFTGAAFFLPSCSFVIPDSILPGLFGWVLDVEKRHSY